MTTATADRPTVGERYGVASSGGGNLRVQESRTDIDIIMAAGMSRHKLGVMLLRLQGEYDGVKREIEHAESAAREADALARRAAKGGSDDGTSLAAAIRKRSAIEILTARYLILSHVKSLRATKEAVGVFCDVQATRQRYMKPYHVVAALAGKVLDVLLDPTCTDCDGTAVHVVSRDYRGSVDHRSQQASASSYRGEVEEPCRACRATGSRRYSIGADERDRWFAGHLLAELQREMAHAAGGIGRLLA